VVVAADFTAEVAVVSMAAVVAVSMDLQVVVAPFQVVAAVHFQRQTVAVLPAAVLMQAGRV
jgi:hypothetical protein